MKSENRLICTAIPSSVEIVIFYDRWGFFISALSDSSISVRYKNAFTYLLTYSIEMLVRCSFLRRTMRFLNDEPVYSLKATQNKSRRDRYIQREKNTDYQWLKMCRQISFFWRLPLLAFIAYYILFTRLLQITLIRVRYTSRHGGRRRSQDNNTTLFYCRQSSTAKQGSYS